MKIYCRICIGTYLRGSSGIMLRQFPEHQVFPIFLNKSPRLTVPNAFAISIKMPSEYSLRSIAADMLSCKLVTGQKWYWTKCHGQNGSNFYRFQFPIQLN